MLKHLLLVAALATCILSAYAESMYMHVILADGTVKIINTDDVHRIKFDNNNMTVSDASGKVLATVSNTQINLIAFDESESASINDVEADDTFSLNGNLLTVAGSTADLEIYGTDGCQLLSIPSLAKGTSVDLSSLQKGIYIVKLGKAAKKIVVK